MSETTFLMIKPDGIQRKLVGEIIQRLEEKGLKLTGLKMLSLDAETAASLYMAHRNKPFFPRLIEFIQSSPVIVSVWKGYRAVHIVRKVVGKTDPLESAPGSIRGDFSLNITYNVVHASDSSKNASREIGLFFGPGEIQEYTLTGNRWMNES